jgi:hypothetical protein
MLPRRAQTALDALTLVVEEHAMGCGARLRRVAGNEEHAYWSAHSIGMIKAGAVRRGSLARDQAGAPP